MTQTQPAEEPFTLAQMAPKRRRTGLIVAVAVIAFLLLLFAAVAGYVLTRPDGDTGGTRGPSTAALVAACQVEVKRQLKAPASARFSEERNAELDDRFYYIDGLVDSQNSFGAQVRTRYRCKAESVDGEWSVIRVEFADWP